MTDVTLSAHRNAPRRWASSRCLIAANSRCVRVGTADQTTAPSRLARPRCSARMMSSTRARRARNAGLRLIVRSRSAGNSTGDLGDHPAGVAGEHDDPVAQKHRLLDIMRDHEHCRTRVLPNLADEDLHVLLGLHVQGTERLVEQQHFRLAGQRSGDRDSLPLPARQLPRQRSAQARQAGLGEIPVDPAGPLGLVDGQAAPARRPRCARPYARGRARRPGNQPAVGSGAGDRRPVQDDLAVGQPWSVPRSWTAASTCRSRWLRPRIRNPRETAADRCCRAPAARFARTW